MALDWKKIATLDFLPDAGLRDIYIFDTNLADWNKVIAAVQKFDPEASYTEDYVVTRLPTRVEDIFERRALVTTTLSFTVGKFAVRCHFFGSVDHASQIEFDFAPEDMTSPNDLEAIVNFMHLLADLTQKRVILALESAPELPILECRPNDENILWVSHNNGFCVSVPALLLPIGSKEETSRAMEIQIRLVLETEDDQIRVQDLLPVISESLNCYAKNLAREGFTGQEGINGFRLKLLERARLNAPGITVKDLWFDQISSTSVLT